MHATTLRTPRPRRPRLIATLAAMLAGVAISFLFIGSSLAAPALQPKTTHPVQDRENCLSCHPVEGGVKASPASHSAYKNEMCIGCHPAAQAAPQAPASQPSAPAQPSTPSQQASPAPQPAVDAPAQPGPAASPSCVDCHKNPGMVIELPSGEKLNLTVSEEEMGKSIHAGKLSCTDCHSRVTGFPHKNVQVNSKREYSIAQYEACKRCHFANYTKTLDGMHYQVMEQGNQNAPLCTDCHGYHNVSDPDEPRTKISLGCSSCHKEVYDSYATSVHGSALINGGNKDVPICTDCHGTHVIRDPGSTSFRLDSPEMCAKCHANAELMSKYGVASNVFKSYSQDFHGVTVALSKNQGSGVATEAAVCSDCHGVHDIASVRQGDPTLVKQRAQEACQKCHTDAGTNFPDAWLGHYDITLEKTPLPWLARAFYWAMIPFMLGGLALHIFVDLWRIARNR